MAVHPNAPRPVLLTRPRAVAEGFAARLPGVEILIAPLMEIVGTGAEVSLEGIAGVIFTSANAVPFVPSAPLPAYCVGPRTADAAKAAGFAPDVRGEDADSLTAALLAERPTGPLLHPHGTHARGDVAARLSARGVETRGVAVYAQNAVTPDATFAAALARRGLVVPLFSPRSARLFAEAVADLPPEARLVALSPNVAEPLPKAWAPMLQVLPRPDPDTMLSAVLGHAMRRISP